MASHRQLREHHLDSFSLRGARRLLERHPEWLPYVSGEEHIEDGLPIRTLRIEIPSEHPSIREPLLITTDRDQIICVSWFSMPGRGVVKWHVDWTFYMLGSCQHRWPDEDYGFDIVSDWVDRVISEDLVATWGQAEDGQWSWSGGMTRDEAIIYKGPRGAGGTTIRSWRGTYDADLGPPFSTSDPEFHQT